jgi:hypothetical protein
MIAAAILECEAIWLRELANQNRREDFKNLPLRPSNEELQRLDIKKFHDQWYRFIVHKLVSDCEKSSDIFNNKVQFITFNYDYSLEYLLYDALDSIDLLNSVDVRKFLSDRRIIHVYGSVRRGPPQDRDIIRSEVASTLGSRLPNQINFMTEFEPRKAFLDRCLMASENLRTIDPVDKDTDGESIEMAHHWVADAGVVYILGYGFDRSNSRRIGMESALYNLRGSGKSVMFTNFGDLDTINKKASRLFYGTFGAFLSQKIHGDPLNGNYIEKSTKNVYDALEQDFGALESELISSSQI